MAGSSTAETVNLEQVDGDALESLEAAVGDPMAIFSGGMVVVAELRPQSIRPAPDLTEIADLVEISHEIPLAVLLGAAKPRVPIDGTDPDEISAVRAIRTVSPVAATARESVAVAVAQRPSSASYFDALMHDAEVLIGQGRWARVVELLVPMEGAPTSPPQIGLLYAIALRECEVSGESVGTASTTDAGHLAIEAIAELMGIVPGSPAAILVARRVLRRTHWRSTPAPPPRTSALIVLAAITVGAVVGWFLGPGKAHLLHLLH